ncbi:MAG: T9SS type A sorting domain-containing protein [Sphingobacteriaceae bacterium]|nr:T9SS type A sorting domain-containing protein [Sphingobacteriaceae bacterium]
MNKFLSKSLAKTCGFLALGLISISYEAVAQFNWSSAGPVYTAGRVRNMVIDKNNSSYLLVGSTSSGIFVSGNSGVEWGPLDDQGSVRNISYMAVSKDGDIFAATGEGFLRATQKAKALLGTGLYKKSGANLVIVADSSKTGTVINKIACSPVNNNMLALAGNKGILLSTDGGANYFVAPGTPSMVGQDIKFDSNGILYCSVGYESTAAGSASTTVWKASTADLGSATFANITPTSIAVTNSNYGRIELAIAPSNANVVYASCAAKYITGNNGSPTLSGLFVSYDGGTTWGTILVGSAQLDPLFNGTTRASGDFAHCLTVSPTNPDYLYMGGYFLYTFQRTGGTNSNPIGNWIKRGNPLFLNSQLYVHENIHDVKIIGSSVYAITDAGIYRSVDGMLSWQPFYKNLITGQFNSVSIERYPLSNNNGGAITPNIGFIGGTGGNGNIYFRGALTGSNVNVNQEVSSIGGDIFATQFSKILPSAAYMTANGPLYRTTNVETSDPMVTELVANTANQSVVNITGSNFTLTGTPFKMWEYYGQESAPMVTMANPDKLYFYNDTSFALSTVPSLTTSTNFTFTVGRPQKKAVMDHIVIRATLVKIVATPATITIPTFTTVDTETLAIQMNTFVLPPTGTLNAPIMSIDGYTSAPTYSLNKVIINSTNQLDEVHVALAGPLFTTQPASSPSVPNIESYVRLKATVYYRYEAGDSLIILYDNISTKGLTYSVTTPTSMRWTQPASSTVNATSNPLQKFDLKFSARLAVAYGNNADAAIYISKAPLDLNTPLSFVKLSANKALTTNSLGIPLSGINETVAITGTPTIIEWSRSGTELYYATNQNYLYRVSYITDILDSTAKSYNGKLHTGIFTYSNTPAPPQYTATGFQTPNPRCPYRTTLLGNFPNKITSISIAQNDSMMLLTFDDASATGTFAMANTTSIKKSDFSNIGFVNKSGSATDPFQTVYCSLLEKKDNKKAFIGTERGIYYTNDVSAASPSWSLANNNQLPRVQIFDIKQQTMNSWECYNSGQIYVATNGRGIWTNNEYYTQTVIGVEEIVKSAHSNNLKLFPNPTNDEVNITFRSYDGENIGVHIMDINGRIVKAQEFGKSNNGDVTIVMDVAELSTGMYIVNVISDSGMRRVSKLIITK